MDNVTYFNSGSMWMYQVGGEEPVGYFENRSAAEKAYADSLKPAKKQDPIPDPKP